MKNIYKPATSSLEINESYAKTVQLPESASIVQLNAFSKAVDEILLTPHNFVVEAYERIFDQPMEDDATATEAEDAHPNG